MGFFRCHKEIPWKCFCRNSSTRADSTCASIARPACSAASSCWGSNRATAARTHPPRWKRPRTCTKARVNVNHPKSHPLASRDYQDRLGLVRNIALRPGAGLFGDFHFNPKHALAEQLLWDAQHAPENVGFSHNVQGRTVRQGDQTVVEAILKVHSVDLVADPATTSGLFEAARPEREETGAQILAACTLEDLRHARPDLVGEIETQSQSELGRLRRRVEELELQAALGDKRAAAGRLLAEFHLPDPDQPGAGGEVVSESFLTALLTAPDETAMRALVAQRARLVRAAAAPVNAGRTGAKPRSREQGLTESSPRRLSTLEEFVQAIR